MYKHGICLSGFLQWINYSRTMICTFDLESDDFQELPPRGWDLESLKKSGLDLGFERLPLGNCTRDGEDEYLGGDEGVWG